MDNSDVNFILGSGANTLVKNNRVFMAQNYAFAGMMCDNFNGCASTCFVSSACALAVACRLAVIWPVTVYFARCDASMREKVWRILTQPRAGVKAT
jgi:hypothetical protein